MDIIRVQSEKLARHLHSFETWECSDYAKTLHIINEETFTSLRDFFTKYASASPNHSQFKAGANKIFRQYYKDVQGFTSILTRSFGVLAPASLIIANHHTQQFWESGVTDISELHNATMVNPLFAYSSIAGDQFAVNSAIDPLSAYHLSAFLPELTSKYTFPQARANFDDSLRINIKNVVDEAKKQFVLWSSAFQQFIKQSGNIVIRFVTADPLAYCFALQQHDRSLQVQLPALSSTPWSGTRLTIPYIVPQEFNVIDTSTLVDHIGTINVLLGTRPLLELSPASSISMETISDPWVAEMLFLPRTLCYNVPVLCIALDIAPLGYLTGVETRGLTQDIPTIADDSGKRPAPILNRIIWKIPALGDSAITLHNPEISCDPREMLLFLFRVYDRMFNVDTELQEEVLREKMELRSLGSHTMSSFVALIAFMKHRVCIPWENMIKSFMESFGGSFPTAQKYFDDLEMQMHIMGVYSPSALGIGSSEFRSDVDLYFERPDRRNRINPEDPMGITCVVFTIPRRRLHAIYEKCFNNTRDVKCTFHFRIYYEDEEEHSVYSNLVPIFGKLIRGTEGQNCRIETDKAGWHGSSDLHVCVYVSTAEVIAVPGQIISFNLTEEPGVSAVFRGDYGPELEIFSARFDDASHVQLVKSIPGYAIPEPKLIPVLCDETIKLTENITITRPGLKSILTDDPVISTKITFSTDAKFSADTKVNYNQTSPCVITVKVGSLDHICQFPFPVDGKSAKLRIARTSGWIEVNVPLNPLGLGTSGYLQAPWPVIRDPKSVCNWNLPSVNFSSLPPIKTKSSIPWYIPHLENMYSDCEQQRDSFTLMDPLTHVKICLLDIFKCINLLSSQTLRVRFGIRQGDNIFVFFITGLFLDSSAHNVVAQAYVVQTKENTPVAALLDEIEYMTLPASPEVAQYWKMAIPAMIERCRNWEHGVKCEHNKSEAEVTICSCGVGKAGPEFLQIRELVHMAPYVTRCALSPLFPSPYIEPTRMHMLDTLEPLKERREMESRTTRSMDSRTTVNACGSCGRPNGMKKCARCESIYYCGRDCQKTDWPRHKQSCRRVRP